MPSAKNYPYTKEWRTFLQEQQSFHFIGRNNKHFSSLEEISSIKLHYKGSPSPSSIPVVPSMEKSKLTLGPNLDFDISVQVTSLKKLACTNQKYKMSKTHNWVLPLFQIYQEKCKIIINYHQSWANNEIIFTLDKVKTKALSYNIQKIKTLDANWQFNYLVMLHAVV
jgi:hypothetical protein